MKKLHSTPNFIKAVSLGTAMAALLSSVSPVFAANLAITGAALLSTSGTGVSYPKASHGSVVFAGDDDHCGADNVVGRGGDSHNSNNRITAEEQYRRFIDDQAFNNHTPYGTTTEKVTWVMDSITTPTGSYMGSLTGGTTNAMPEAYGVYSFATGCGSSATGNYSTVFGANATAKAGGAQAFGVSALASGKASVAMGVGSEASGESTVAIGGLATASGKNSVALGARTKASAEYTVAIGSQAEARALGAIAIGGSEPVENNGQDRFVVAYERDAIAIGSHAHAEKAHSVAIGVNALVRVKDGVAIGGGSVSLTDKGVFGYDPTTKKSSTDNSITWKSTAGAFSIGEVGGEDGQGQLTRQITGVAAGSEDTDAVNVAQLKALRNVIAGDGGWKISVNNGDFTDVKAGSVVDFSVKTSNGVGQDNLKIEKNNENKVKFVLSDTLKLTSITTGKSFMSDQGLVITDGPGVTGEGIDAGSKKITKVAEGTEDTDAVNYKQLKEIKDLTGGAWKLAVNDGVSTDVKAGSTVKFVGIKAEDGNEESRNIKITKDDQNNVSFALNDIIRVKRVIAGNANVSDNGFVITGGPNMTTGGINAGNKQVKGVANGTLDNDAVNVAQLKEIKNQIAGNGLVKWDKDQKLITIGKEKDGNKIDITNSTSQSRVISGVSNGKISSASTEAVNGSQIDKISQDVANYFGGSASFEDGAFKRPKYSLSVIVEDGQVAKVSYYNVGDALTGLDANVKSVNNRVTNIANEFTQKIDGFSKDALLWSEEKQAFVALHGTNGEKTKSKLKFLLDGDISKGSTDAVNGSQLFKTNQTVANLIETLNGVNQNISNYFGGGANVLSDKAPTYTIQNNEYNDVGSAFSAVDVSITNISNQITNATKNSLVKQEGGTESVITIGKATGGTKISIANSAGVGRTISGVNAAVNGDEAVNKNQLDKSIEKISKDIEVASAAAVLYDKNEDGSINYGSVTLGGNKSKGAVSLFNVKDGRIAANSTDAITGNQLYLMSNQLAVYFGGGAGYKDGKWTTPNFKISQFNADGTVNEQMYQNVADAFGGINGGMTNINDRINQIEDKVDTDALKWNKDKGAYDASHNGQPSKIINVANGKIAKDSTDAVNGGQLWQINERISGVEKDVKHIENRVDNISNTIADIGDIVTNIDNKVDNIEATVNNIADGVVSYDKDENGKKTNKVTLAGGNESEPVMIDNLADGKIEKGSKEAVNGGQLHDYTKEQMEIVLDQSKHYTDQRVRNIVVDAIDDAVERSNHYTDMKFEALNYTIEGVRKEARQAAAIGLAVSNLRYNDTPGKLSIAFGSGLWRNQSAFALGAGYSSENGKIRSNLSVTSSGGHWGVGAGFNMTLN
ncbi:Vomp family autotransporter [Bartonella gliris]|uniref:Vomp family autotransporter n=1 Tax=Bartonella gliris TaxID=3004109 RepID=UPI00295E4007|nr:Vomp family autotransporter [Bartonella gliris]